MSELINIETGEILNEDSDNHDLCNAYLAIDKEIKKLEKLKSSIKNAILDRVHEGDKKFEYLDIRWSSRSSLVFESKHDEKAYNRALNILQKPFKVSGVPKPALYPPKY